MVLGFVLLYLLSDVVVILLFSIVIASAVSPFVAWFQKFGVPRIISVLALYLMVLGAIAALSSLVLPSVLDELSSMSAYIPKITNQLTTSLDTVQQGAPKYFDFVSEVQNIVEMLAGYLQQFSQSAFNLAIGAFGGLFSFVAIIVISFYLSVMKNGIQNFLAAIVPERYEEYIADLWRRVEIKVGLWLQGQMLLALIVGLLVFVGLTLLEVRFALVFAIMAMLLEIVPVAGPVLAAIPAILMAFIQSPTLGLWVLLCGLLFSRQKTTFSADRPGEDNRAASHCTFSQFSSAQSRRHRRRVIGRAGRDHYCGTRRHGPAENITPKHLAKLLAIKT